MEISLYILKIKKLTKLATSEASYTMTQGKGQVWAQVAREPRAVLLSSRCLSLTFPAMMLAWLWLSLLLTTAILASSPTKTPMVTCCPPGSFLAIEDSLKSRQLPNGTWEGSEPYEYNWDEGSVSQLPQHNSPMLAHKSFHRPYDFRHNYISSVYCVPDQNDLPPIDGFAGSSYPHTIFNSTKPLSGDQILESTGKIIELIN